MSAGEKIADAIVYGATGAVALGTVGIGAAVVNQMIYPSDSSSSIEPSCAQPAEGAFDHIDDLANGAETGVSIGPNGEVQFGLSASDEEKSRNFIETTLERFTFLDIDGFDEAAEQTLNLAELRELANSYVEPLGWKFNFGRDADYPNLVYSPDPDAEGEPYVEEEQKDDVQIQISGILSELNRMPVELLQQAELNTINIFEAWYALGMAHNGYENRNHISMVLMKTKTGRSVWRHELGHIYKFGCNPGFDYAFAELNRDNFVYNQDTRGDVNHAEFGSDGADENIEEDEAAAYEELFQIGLRNASDPQYRNILEQKKRHLAAEFESTTPGITDYFILLNMLARAELEAIEEQQ